jgi:ABC-type glycerol-3-phosphate transport system permease component
MIRFDLKDRLFITGIHIVLFCLGLVIIIPLFYIVSVSLTPYEEVLRRGGIILWPTRITFTYYRYILNVSSPVLRAFGVTILVTLVGTAISLFVTVITAYPLSKKYLPGRKFFMYLFLATMIFSGGIIPTFLVVRSFGLIDSLWALMLPPLIRVFNMIVMRTFFSSIPQSLEESARLDGCTDIGILFRIVIPTSSAALATIGLFYAVARWNAFFDAYIYINDPLKYTLQIVLRRILVLSQIGELADGVVAVDYPPLLSLQMASAIIAVLPMAVLYPYLQRFFVKGVMIGSVKG